MCIIVVKPKGQEVNKEILERCSKRNGDGQGFAYFCEADSKIKVRKNLKHFNQLWSKYKKEILVPKIEKDTTVIWHFRIATHGATSTDNCHPFLATKSIVAFAHNGVINNSVDRTSQKSDTHLFKDNIINHLPDDFLQNEGIMRLMIEYIGMYSKLAFIDKDGDYFIVNESDGEWDDGLWYSNSGYKAVKTVTTPWVNKGRYNPMACGYNQDDDETLTGYKVYSDDEVLAESENWRSGYTFDQGRQRFVKLADTKTKVISDLAEKEKSESQILTKP
jgi:glutamine amidotransferase